MGNFKQKTSQELWLDQLILYFKQVKSQFRAELLQMETYFYKSKGDVFNIKSSMYGENSFA